jgi:hypothetical protein
MAVAAGGSDDVAALFAAVRPCDGLTSFVPGGRAPELVADRSATMWILAEGLGRADRAERERIVAHWGSLRRGSCAPIVADGGCDVRIGGSGVSGAERTAMLRWLPLSRTDFAVYESGLFRESPAEALTLLVRPPTVWSIDEAIAADRLLPRGPRFEPARFEALERYARARVGREHLARVRGAAARIEAQLPRMAFPVASATVGAGCAVVAADDARCAAVAARQLARYAVSARVGRRTQVAEDSVLLCAC